MQENWRQNPGVGKQKSGGESKTKKKKIKDTNEIAMNLENRRQKSGAKTWKPGDRIPNDELPVSNYQFQVALYWHPQSEKIKSLHPTLFFPHPRESDDSDNTTCKSDSTLKRNRNEAFPVALPDASRLLEISLWSPSIAWTIPPLIKSCQVFRFYQ